MADRDIARTYRFQSPSSAHSRRAYPIVIPRANYHPPYECLTLRPPGRRRDAPGDFVRKEGRACSRLTPSYLGQSVARQRLGISSSYALSPTNYVVRSTRRFLRATVSLSLFSSLLLRPLFSFFLSFFYRVGDTRTCHAFDVIATYHDAFPRTDSGAYQNSMRDTNSVNILYAYPAHSPLPFVSEGENYAFRCLLKENRKERSFKD